MIKTDGPRRLHLVPAPTRVLFALSAESANVKHSRSKRREPATHQIVASDFERTGHVTEVFLAMGAVIFERAHPALSASYYPR